MTLAETQAAFWANLTSAPGAPAADLFLVGTARLEASARVAIYADMFLFRQVDALREDFEKLALLLGDAGFFELISGYVAVHPSVDPSLARRGAQLSAFLQGREEGALADLAALEYARAQAFGAEDAEPAPVDLLVGWSAEAFSERGLALVPSLQTLQLAHDVTASWRALEREEEVDAPTPSATVVAVWRQGFKVFHAPLEPAEADALARAQRGESLAAVCAALESPEAAFSMLGSWLNDGWVRGVRRA